MRYITTSYTCPDLDGYSCAVAYAEFLRAQGKDATTQIWGEPQLEVQWIIETFSLQSNPVSNDSFVDFRVVLLDASNPEDLPSPLRSDQVIEVIDHRKIHRGSEFINAVLQIEIVGAAATLVAERFQKANIIPSKKSAFLLLGGIISNSQNFIAVGTTDRDKTLAMWLREISGAPDDLAEQMFRAKSDLSGERLQTALQGDTKIILIQNRRVGIAQMEIFDVKKLIDERRDEIEAILQKIKQDFDCSFTFVNMKDLGLGISYVLCVDDQTSQLLQSVPDVTWSGRLGLSKRLTLRKQLSAWIDEKLSTYV